MSFQRVDIVTVKGSVTLVDGSKVEVTNLDEMEAFLASIDENTASLDSTTKTTSAATLKNQNELKILLNSLNKKQDKTIGLLQLILS